jgi:hypothetical protein
MDGRGFVYHGPRPSGMTSSFPTSRASCYLGRMVAYTTGGSLRALLMTHVTLEKWLHTVEEGSWFGGASPGKVLGDYTVLTAQ